MSQIDELDKYIAHSQNRFGVLETLREHILRMISYLEQDNRRYSYIVNLVILHDLGKAYHRNQERLQKAGQGIFMPREEHALSSASCCIHRLADTMIVKDHHGGLSSISKCIDLQRDLVEVIGREKYDFMRDLYSKIVLDAPDWIPHTKMDIQFSFSDLVDIDWLATEEHLSLNLSDLRKTIPLISRVFEEFHHRKASFKPANSPMSAPRDKGAGFCRQASTLPRNLYSLTLPTGCGKTRSAICEFGIPHMELHGLRRIILLQPLNTITKQTANLCREWFGSDVVLEHHCNAMPEGTRWAIGGENWAFPVIVSSHVAGFQTLTGCKRSELRRLRNYEDSLIIIDEIHALPLHLRKYCLSLLKNLVDHYGCSVLMMSGTPIDFSLYDSHPVEIIPNPQHFYDITHRAQIKFIGCKTYDQLAQIASQEHQTAVTLNTKQNAYRTFQACAHFSDLVFLSRACCPQHLSDSVDLIKHRLMNGLPVKVICTQVLENGADITFSGKIFRENGPLTALLQNLGRSNRHGNSSTPGQLEVFELLDGSPPPGREYEAGCAITLQMLKRNRDFNDLSVLHEFGQKMFDSIGNSKSDNLQKLDISGDYDQVAELAKLIQSNDVPMLVPYDVKVYNDIVDRLTNGKTVDYQEFQRHSVCVSPGVIDTFTRIGIARYINESYVVYCGKYNKDTGVSNALYN